MTRWGRGVPDGLYVALILMAVRSERSLWNSSEDMVGVH